MAEYGHLQGEIFHWSGRRTPNSHTTKFAVIQVSVHRAAQEEPLTFRLLIETTPTAELFERNDLVKRPLTTRVSLIWQFQGYPIALRSNFDIHGTYLIRSTFN